MSPDVTSCYHNAPQAQNKGLMNDSEADVTSLFPHLCSLSPMQMRALALRIQGEPVGRIAKKLGLTRQTIYRWCNHYPAFVAN